MTPEIRSVPPSDPSEVDPDFFAVEVRGLRKIYRTRRGPHSAVAGLDLSAPRGGVHGFLGPNGSGKTTTIRMLLGLVRADGGRMRLLGTDVPTGLPSVIDRVGAIVERPKFFPAFTGRRSLEMLAAAIDVPRSRIGAVLDEVGLTDRAGHRFSTYSLGMRQRLAVAATLLKDPELLIFDEPTNGLDPAGIQEMRATLRGLADRGKTVLMSSHLLGEVQQVADTVSIIGRGRLLAEGDVASMLDNFAQRAVRLQVSDPGYAAGVLAAAGYRPEPGGDGTLLVRSDAVTGVGALDPARITEVLARQGLFVSELITVRPDLEEVFLRLTSGHQLRTDLTGEWTTDARSRS